MRGFVTTADPVDVVLGSIGPYPNWVVCPQSLLSRRDEPRPALDPYR